MNLNLNNIPYTQLKEKFKNSMKFYQKTRGKKINIISIVRDPRDRLPSSFFQSYHDDEMNFSGKKENETTVNTNSHYDLYKIFIDSLINDSLPGRVESIDEISEILGENIIPNLEMKDEFYYLENDFFILYVLDFNKLITKNGLNYFNNCLNMKMTVESSANMTINKVYYEKYQNMKSIIGNYTNNLIVSKYDKFFFNAFPRS